MPECRRCGLALAPDEGSLCEACWDATEADCDEMAEQDEQESLSTESHRQTPSGHVGWHKWENGKTYLGWTCSRNCPHPDHDEEGR